MPIPESVLTGVTVVVTRPEHQADGLCQSIEALGGTALRFPVIEIQPITNSDTLKKQLSQLDYFQLAIFISANAVFSTLQMLEAKHGWPVSLPIAAVGQATARAIAAKGMSATYISPEPYNSEALLALPDLQSMQGKRVIIFRGIGGRDYLGDTLRDRGAEVEYAECYQRVVPNTDTSELFRLWDQGKSMPIVVTSNEGLENLVSMVDSAHQQSLLQAPLIVISQRAVIQAEQMGFRKKPLVADCASNDAIMSAIKQWKKS